VGFRDQVLCTRYTAGGDSGAAVLNKRRYLVGLHFAGSMSASVFNPVQPVFRSLAIELA
jgi:V8-like Glu-specific endopeptidase